MSKDRRDTAVSSAIVNELERRYGRSRAVEGRVIAAWTDRTQRRQLAKPISRREPPRILRDMAKKGEIFFPTP